MNQQLEGDVPPGHRQAARPAGVIHAKCRVPPVSDELVERPRLVALLGSLIAAHSPVSVYATAGSGKTTAVVQALDPIGLPVAWLTVDETDAAPGRLLTYLEAALARAAPAVGGVASGALRQGVPHRETAGLLAEATGAAPVLLVVDELERIAAASDALGVLSALVRYAPAAMRIILISRRELPLDLGSGAAFGRAVALREDDLAFTAEEAATALTRRGQGEIDPEAAVEVTGGWVAGVLFEAWRSADHVIGIGGEADPLHGYLASQVLDQLDADQQEFLIATALLPEVTATRALALGETEGGRRLAEIRSKHLPVAWDGDGQTMRCHTRFREYLLARLERRPAGEVVALRTAYGELLEQEGHHEDAVEEFLRAGALSAALRAAEVALDSVVERLDFALAERWLSALKPVAPPGDSALTRAELMLSLIGEHYEEGVRLADRLAFLGEREAVARRSRRTASMMAWCYWHAGRIDDARQVISVADDGADVDAIHYLLALVSTNGSGPTPMPELTGGPLDALIMRVNYAHGRFRQMADSPALPWAAAVAAPWQIGALRAMGRTGEALEVYEAYGVTDGAPVWFHAIVEPELMIDLGRSKQARDALAHGRSLIRESGSVVVDMLNRVIEVKLELRLSGDPEQASALLRDLEARPEAGVFGFIKEQIDVWSGMTLLLSRQDAAAARRLRRAVKSMRAADRILELPTAAVFLAESEWRLDRPKAAADAAELALAAAARQGSNHILLQALSDFPSVAARCIDAEPRADSEWHELGRSLMAQGAQIELKRETVVHLDEFGEPTISVDGVQVRPRIKKSYELLAYLASSDGHEADREELLDALFDGRSDDSTRSYLRQAAHRLRQVLPDGAGLVFEGSRLRLGPELALSSESARIDELLARAARLQGDERLGLLLQALESLDRGEYLAGVHTPWVDERRERIGRSAADARHEAAELSYSGGQYRQADRLASGVLRSDPYRERTWRLLMKIANATGDDDRVIATYRLCERALGQLGTGPSASTRALLDALRK